MPGMHDRIVPLYLLFLFATVSIAGWCMEVIFRSICCRGLIIPGFLTGPYCPIYGFGMVAVTLVCRNKNKWMAFAEIFVLATALEYLVSFFFETVFHMLLWDYSMIPFSIGTRVSLVFSVIWGLLGMFAVKNAEPLVRDFYIRHKRMNDIAAEALTAVIAADTILNMI